MDYTPNYGLVTASDSDQMNDVSTYLNGNWSKLTAAMSCPIVSVLPISDYSYHLGSRIFHTPSNSVYVLVATNSGWGNFWKPVQARYSPWIQPPSSSIIASYGITYKENTSNPPQYMISNTGTFRMRGAVDAIAANGFVDRETGVATPCLNNIPPTVAPAFRYVMLGTIYGPASSTAKPFLAQLSFHADGTVGNTVWNPVGTGKSLYFSGAEWVMGYTKGYGPND